MDCRVDVKLGSVHSHRMEMKASKDIFVDLRVDSTNHTLLAMAPNCLGTVEPDRLQVCDSDCEGCGGRHSRGDEAGEEAAGGERDAGLTKGGLHDGVVLCSISIVYMLGSWGWKFESGSGHVP
jgi:hypothetical protein